MPRVSRSPVGGLEFGGWDVSAALIEASVVEPVNPLGGAYLDEVEGSAVGHVIRSVVL